MPRYLSSTGLVALRAKIAEQEARIGQMHKQGAKDYHQSGDAWHDNPVWELSNQQRRAAQKTLSELKELEVEHVLLDDLPFNGDVSPGSVVTIRWEGENETEEWTILGEGESDPDNYVISFETDLAKALMDHSKDDVADFRDQKITIVDVKKWIPA